MNQEDYVKRYVARIVAKTRAPDNVALEAAMAAVEHAHFTDQFLADPEGDADDEVSNWEAS